MEKNMKKIEEIIIQVGLKIAKRNEGALFIIGEVEHKPLVNQTVHSFDIISNPKLLESLALMDGAIIIDKNGFLSAYGTMVKSKKVLKNFGTRHSAAISASYNGNMVILVSEEDKKIRIFKEGKLTMQIDALQKNIEKSVSNAVNLLESVGAGTIGTIGTSLLAPMLGVSLLPGILVFGSAYYIGKLITEKFKK